MSSVPQSRTDRLNAIWAHSKFRIALVVTFGLDALLVFLYTVVNPFPVPYLSLAQSRARFPNLIAVLLTKIYIHSTCSR